MRLLTVNGTSPRIAADAFVAEGATVAGDVELGAEVSVWFGCVLRAERAPIVVGPRTNIQDLCVVHTDAGQPARLGARVTVGHRAILHGCTIDDDALVGMGAIVMNGAHIGAGAVVAAGAVVTEDTHIAAGTLAVGVPARQRDAELPALPRDNVASYVELAAWYRAATTTVGSARQAGREA